MTVWGVSEVEVVWTLLMVQVRNQCIGNAIVVVQSLSHFQLFWDPTDYSLPGSSVHGISQARILEWVSISLSHRSSQPRDRICVSFIGRQILHHWPTREVLLWGLFICYRSGWFSVLKTFIPQFCCLLITFTKVSFAIKIKSLYGWLCLFSFMTYKY